MINRLSMRTSLGLTIALMGLVSILLVLSVGELHRRNAFDSHRAALANLVKLAADDLLAQGVVRAGEIGVSIQSDGTFVESVVAAEQSAIARHLDSQFRQYFVTTNAMKLEELYVLDAQLAPVARSTQGLAGLPEAVAVCPQLFDTAKRRAGAERLKLLGAICVHQGLPHQAVLVPVGGLRVRGYLLVLTDPAHSLRPAESSLGMPLRITTPDGAVRYESSDWPPGHAPVDSLLVEYPVLSAEQNAALVATVVANVAPFYAGLRDTHSKALVMTALTTLVAMFAAMWLLKRSTLNPLGLLAQQLQRVRQDKKHLGEHVAVGGNREIRELATDFNKMTSELSTLYSKLENIAYTDALTRLANRARFHETLQAFTGRDGQPPRAFALVIIDVSRFKVINDSLGHEVGDQLLIQFAVRLEQTLRRLDSAARLDRETLSALSARGYALARLGGDEFAVLLPGVETEAQAAAIAQKMLTAMTQPFAVDGSALKIDLSIGIVLSPEHGTDAGSLLRRADVAVAEAKRRHGGYHCYNRSNDQHRLFQLTLERELRTAIDRDTLELHFQPQLAFADGSVIGMEALLRWRHPERGYIPPDQFIPIAEQSGLINPLTHWVLDKALGFWADLANAGQIVKVSVNLSARNLHDPELPKVVKRALDKHGASAQHLALEITESAVMVDPDRALEILSELDEMGLELSIDDFGTGYSSMAYLKRLPVDEIKIDRSFVREMRADNSDMLIVRAIVDLAHNLGMRAVAEGVEDEASWNLLATLGCDVAQGYYISRPIAAAAFRTWLHERQTGALALAE